MQLISPLHNCIECKEHVKNENDNSNADGTQKKKGMSKNLLTYYLIVVRIHI